MTEFEKYAFMQRGISGNTLASYMGSATQSLNRPAAGSQFAAYMGAVTPADYSCNADIFSQLLSQRKIVIGEQIDNIVANIVQAQLLFLASMDPEADISIYLNTPGGEMFSGLGIYDTMMLVEPEICTVCTGLAASMGAVLLCAGQKGKRFALKHSRVMMHQPHGGAGGQASDILIQARQIEISRNSMYQIFSEHTGQQLERIAEDAERDCWMSASEAVDYGLIDRVLGE